MIGLSPRFPVFPLDLGKPGDLRLEDLLVVPLLLVALARLPARWRRIWSWPLIFFGAYVAWTGITTAIGIVADRVPWQRGVLMWGKYVEYLAVMVVFSVLVETERARRMAVGAVLVAAGVNAIWGIARAAAWAWWNVRVGPWWHGPGLVFEDSPLSSGLYYVAAALMGCIWFSRTRSIASCALAMLCATALGLTGSRAGLLGLYAAAAGMTGIVLGTKHNALLPRLSPVWVIVAAATGSFVLCSQSLFPWKIEKAAERLMEQRNILVEDFNTFLDHASALATGHGIGANYLPAASGATTWYEAHCAYLRAMADGGVPALLGLVAFLVTAAMMGYRLSASEAGPDGGIGWALLGCVLGMAGAGLVHDAFHPHIPMFLLCALTGLYASAKAGSVPAC
jgi:hypothetical protein